MYSDTDTVEYPTTGTIPRSSESIFSITTILALLRRLFTTGAT